MPEPTTVWMVRLRKGEMGERKGRLTLDAEGLVFRDEEWQQARVLAYEQIQRVKRVRGSPILIVSHDDDRGVRQTAFYFTEPPPLAPEDPFAVTESSGAVGKPMSPLAAMRRNSKRRHMRENVRYLTTKSGSRKPEIRSWVEEITAQLRG